MYWLRISSLGSFMASLLRTSKDLRTNALSGEETPWQMLDRSRAEQESCLGSCSLMSGAMLPRVSRALTARPPHREQIHNTRNLHGGGGGENVWLR